MTDILLITDLQLTQGTPLGGNIDIDKYRSVIKEVQVFTIEPALGTKLYDKILTDFDADTLAGLYLTIHTDYLVPIIVHNVAAEYIEMGGIVVNNAGIFVRSPENTTPISPEEVNRYAAKERNKANAYMERLQIFLCDQQGSIPEYIQAQDNNYDVRPDREINLSGGWRLEDKHYPSNAYRELWKDIFYEHGKA